MNEIQREIAERFSLLADFNTPNSYPFDPGTLYYMLLSQLEVMWPHIPELSRVSMLLALAMLKDECEDAAKSDWANDWYRVEQGRKAWAQNCIN